MQIMYQVSILQLSLCETHMELVLSVQHNAHYKIRYMYVCRDNMSLNKCSCIWNIHTFAGI